MITCAIHFIINPRNCTDALNCSFNIVVAVNFSYVLPVSRGRPAVSVQHNVLHLLKVNDMASGTWEVPRRDLPSSMFIPSPLSGSLDAGKGNCHPHLLGPG